MNVIKDKNAVHFLLTKIFESESHTLTIMKIALLFICFSLFVASHGEPLPLQEDPVDDFLKYILDAIKAAMPNGIPDLNIPPLDPFEVPPFDDIHLE